MGQYANGTPISLPMTFIDEDTGDPFDPDGVVYFLRTPDDALTTLEFGVSAAVTNCSAIPVASRHAPTTSARVSLIRSPSRGWMTEAAAHATAPIVRMSPAAHGFHP